MSMPLEHRSNTNILPTERPRPPAPPQAISATSGSRLRWSLLVGLLFGTVAACNPNTTRPPFTPFPQAVVDTVQAYRSTVVADIAGRLAAEGLEFKRANARDGYLETQPYDAVAQKRAGPNRTEPARVVTFRFWMDSLPNRQTRITAEITHPSTADPSLPSRVNDVMSRPGDPGWDIFDRVLTGMRKRFRG